jgi:hypothetical protein
MAHEKVLFWHQANAMMNGVSETRRKREFSAALKRQKEASDLRSQHRAFCDECKSAG